MKYRKISLSCACGQVPGSLSTVGLSTDHQLVIHWRCAKCNREIHVARSLADCWRKCPKEGDTDLNDSEMIADKRFLRDLGIKGDS